MKIVEVKPVPTGNPIADFSKAVESEFGELIVGEDYQFGDCIVSFYSGKGNLIGMNHFRKIESKSENLYSFTRIQPNLKKINGGMVVIEKEIK